MTIVIAIGVVLALAVWLFAPRAPRVPEPGEEPEPIDLDALEAAEREVQDLGLHQRPEEGFEGDDWGPGAARHPKR